MRFVVAVEELLHDEPQGSVGTAGVPRDQSQVAVRARIPAELGHALFLGKVQQPQPDPALRCRPAGNGNAGEGARRPDGAVGRAAGRFAQAAVTASASRAATGTARGTARGGCHPAARPDGDPAAGGRLSRSIASITVGPRARLRNGRREGGRLELLRRPVSADQVGAARARDRDGGRQPGIDDVEGFQFGLDPQGDAAGHVRADIRGNGALGTLGCHDEVDPQ